MSQMSLSTSRSAIGRSAVALWLYGMAALVFAMVIVGGATRLTDSGLSITEWQPLLGAIPPYDEAHWIEAFEKYKAIPEYQLVNQGMSLEEFKVIYWWEWSHRFLGRFIGLAFFVPFVGFWFAGLISRRLAPKLIAIFALGALQGGLGWYMVKSGLADRVDVSQYRLSAHLMLAALIFGSILWVGFGLDERKRELGSGTVAALGLVALVLLQIAAGGLVAGLDAGMGYNTWPLMDGALVPSGLGVVEPRWKNLFENALTVQFDHRMLAYALTALAALNAWTARTHIKGSALLLFVAVLLQAAGGVWTLLSQVPIPLALMHQAGAMLVLAAALWHLHRATQTDEPLPAGAYPIA